MRKSRIAKAIKEYNGKHWKPNEAAFYPEDIREILEAQGITEKRKEPIADALQDALKAGFMIGYRKGKADAKKELRKDPKPAKDDGTRADLKSLDKATLDALANMDCLEYYHFCAGKGVSLNYYTPAFDNMNHYPEGASIEQAENFTYLFDAFIELLTAGEVNPKRYEQVVMNRYNCDMKSRFYFLAMGFCGALETLAHIENRIDQEEQAEDMVIL